MNSICLDQAADGASQEKKCLQCRHKPADIFLYGAAQIGTVLGMNEGTVLGVNVLFF